MNPKNREKNRQARRARVAARLEKAEQDRQIKSKLHKERISK